VAHTGDDPRDDQARADDGEEDANNLGVGKVVGRVRGEVDRPREVRVGDASGRHGVCPPQQAPLLPRGGEQRSGGRSVSAGAADCKR